jgi:hypothetical protein
MLGSALLEMRTGVAPIAATLSENDLVNPVFATTPSLFDQLPVSNDNPRSLEEELGARLAGAQRELSIVSMYLTPEFRTGTMRQLANLLNAASWDEDDVLLDVVSVKTFARAMAILRPHERPMLGLAPNGNLLAMWGSGTRRVSFEFLPTDEIKWFVHSPTQDDRDVGAGTTVLARIRRILDAHEMTTLLHGEG